MCHIKSTVVEQASCNQDVDNNTLGDKGIVVKKEKVLKRKRKRSTKGALLKKTKIEKEISLIQASRTGNIEILLKILSRDNIDINEQAVGCTALHYASFYNHLEVVKLLVENNAEIDIQNTSGLTPINWAVEKGNKEIVLYLLDKCDPSLADNHGFTPLHKAAANGDLEIVQILLSVNTDSEIWVPIDDVTKECGYTPLHLAIMKCKLEVAKILIQNKANVSAISYSGATPLHYSVCKPQLDFIDYLICNHADVNAVDYNLRTPLHWACIYSQLEAVKFLLQHGADLTAHDSNSNTPLDLAVDLSIQEYLKSLPQ